MEEHTEDARNEEDLSRLPVSPRAYYVLMAALIKYHQVKIAVRASLLANIALAVLQC